MHGQYSFFSELFTRYFQRHGYSDYSFRGNTPFHYRERFGTMISFISTDLNLILAADWEGTFPRFPTKEELMRETVPDKPSKPKATQSKDERSILVSYILVFPSGLSHSKG
jgi:hypothetical protein